MKPYFRIVLIVLILSSIKAYAQQSLGVIPYKIANPSDNFGTDTGEDYAKLMSLTARLTRDLNIIPHDKVDAALKNLSLNSQRIITEQNIIKIGESINAENILIGTLSRAKNRYISDSILYSITDKRIASRSRASSAGILKLSGAEANDILFNFPVRNKTIADRKIDATIVIDLSYKIASEWESVKKGIIEFAEEATENWNMDTVINIVPFSDKHSISNKFFGLKSFLSLNEKLNTLIPAGTNSRGNFEKAVNYSMKNIPWRRDSEKIFIIISNYEGADAGSAEQHALYAKTRKMNVYTISLGLLSKDAAEPLRQFAVISSGHYIAAAYRQRFYDEKGNPVDVFLEGGRLFNSVLYDDSWKSGLFENNRNRFSRIDKPRSFLNEIFYDERKYNINPYNLSRYYTAITRSSIINSERLEDNISALLQNIGEGFAGSYSRLKYKKPIAKALITDGKISLWIKIKEESDLDVLKRAASDNSVFPLGVTIKKSRNDPYGITFAADSLITGYGNDFIPRLVKADLGAVVKNPDHYASTGLLNPPVWFIDIRVEKIESLRREYDIRESGR